MSVYGIGIDVVEVERIGSSIASFGERFEEKIFTVEEISYCRSQKRPHIHFAARFAAKEAVAKALGTGIGKDVGWLDMEVVRAANGEPSMKLTGAAKEFSEKNKISEIKISLSHTDYYAAANAVALL